MQSAYLIFDLAKVLIYALIHFLYSVGTSARSRTSSLRCAVKHNGEM